MPTPHLPAELLLAILHQVRNASPGRRAIPTLWASTLVSRSWHAAANVVLYDEINLAWVPWIAVPLLHTILENISIRPLVHSLILDFPDLATDVRHLDRQIRNELFLEMSAAWTEGQRGTWWDAYERAGRMPEEFDRAMDSFAVRSQAEAEAAAHVLAQPREVGWV